MPVELLAALHDTGIATVMRQGRWLYPVVNTGHILGIALLFGVIVPLDLRLIGLWPTTPVEPLARTLVPVAAAGAALAVLTGLLLFSVQPVTYAGTALFQVKMVLVLFGIANALLLRRRVAWCRTWPAPRLRLAGAASLTLWTATVFCGRFLGYI